MMQLRLPATVEHWPIDRLRPYGRNPRTHSEEQVAQIAASMAEFGWTNPVLASAEGEVIAGHGRLEAARKLGLREAPVLVLEHLTPEQRRAYLIVDNKLALNAGWDDALLAAELAQLKDEGFDLALTGFGEDELDRLLDGDAAAESDEDVAPEPPADPISRPGDLWLCGAHRVLCGDATVLADVERLLGGELADMCFADPPYNVNYANGAQDKRMGRNRPILNDALGEDFARCSTTPASTSSP